MDDDSNICGVASLVRCAERCSVGSVDHDEADLPVTVFGHVRCKRTGRDRRTCLGCAFEGDYAARDCVAVVV